VREPEELPVEEVAAAASAVLEANLAMPVVELARETARVLLGHARLGRKVAEVMEAAIALLVARGDAARDGGRIIRTAR
jgi:urease gamma subunit